MVGNNQTTLRRVALGDLDVVAIWQHLFMGRCRTHLKPQPLSNPILAFCRTGAGQKVMGRHFEDLVEPNHGDYGAGQPRVNLFKAAVPLHHTALSIKQHEATDHALQRLVQRAFGLCNCQAGRAGAIQKGNCKSARCQQQRC